MPTQKSRTCLVTGSTDGIGKAAAVQLARRGHRVIVHGRNEERGRSAMADISHESGSDSLDLVVADFTSLEQVAAMARDVGERIGNVDVLINNAGVYEREWSVTEDGIETTLQVNFLAPFLLTNLLTGVLEANSPSRIVGTASVAHHAVHSVDFDNLQSRRSYDAYDVYATSKLAIVCFTYLLAEPLESEGVTVNCLHPGVIATKLLHAGFPGTRGAPPEVGGGNEAYLATSAEVEGVTGKYFDERSPTRSSALSHNEEIQRRFWETAERLTGVSRHKGAA